MKLSKEQKDYLKTIEKKKVIKQIKKEWKVLDFLMSISYTDGFNPYKDFLNNPDKDYLKNINSLSKIIEAFELKDICKCSKVEYRDVNNYKKEFELNKEKSSYEIGSKLEYSLKDMENAFYSGRQKKVGQKFNQLDYEAIDNFNNFNEFLKTYNR